MDPLDGELGGPDGGGHLRWTFTKTVCRPCSCPHPASCWEQVWCPVAALGELSGLEGGKPLPPPVPLPSSFGG